MSYRKDDAQESMKAATRLAMAGPTGTANTSPANRVILTAGPTGSRNFKTAVKATLKAPVKVTREGKSQKVSTLEAMLLRLREKALSGDLRALDRADPASASLQR